MATAADAELILKLYELRREEVMRKARNFMGGEFHPATLDDLFAVTRGSDEKNAYWRQTTSFWEMAASLVLRGALDADLFIDNCAEAFFFLAKMDHLRGEYHAKTGNVMMRNVSTLIDKYPAAAERYQRVATNVRARLEAKKA